MLFMVRHGWLCDDAVGAERAAGIVHRVRVANRQRREARG